jgi:hypothetical protein
MQHKFDISTLNEWAEQLSQDFLPAGWEPVASSAYTRVTHHREQQLYYKQFLSRSPMERGKAALRGSRATRARRNGDALQRAGFDAPINLHWGKVPGGSEFLYCRESAGQGVGQWLQKHGASVDLKRQLLEELGIHIGRLHQCGFVHGDLRPDNILAEHRGDRFHFTLLDNERNRRIQPPPGRALLRNLMQLSMLSKGELTRRDRLRFFRAWSRQLPTLSQEETKLLATEADRWARARLERKRLAKYYPSH